jgi:RHS repeat-associated protein
MYDGPSMATTGPAAAVRHNRVRPAVRSSPTTSSSRGPRLQFEVRVAHFTGKERDAETGLDYFGARYFGSPQGRFTSPVSVARTRSGTSAVPREFLRRSWGGVFATTPRAHRRLQPLEQRSPVRRARNDTPSARLRTHCSAAGPAATMRDTTKTPQAAVFQT